MPLYQPTWTIGILSEADVIQLDSREDEIVRKQTLSDLGVSAAVMREALRQSNASKPDKFAVSREILSRGLFPKSRGIAIDFDSPWFRTNRPGQTSNGSPLGDL